MDWLLGALLVFLLAVGLVIALIVTKPAAEEPDEGHCVYCGTTLKVVAGNTTPICQECGREQPGAKSLIGHGRH